MTFHDKYTRVNKWWQKAEFRLDYDIVFQTDIVGYTYEDEYVKLDRFGRVTIKAGFDWGASGLTWDTRSSRRGSIIHDAIYYLSQMKVFDDAPNNHALRLSADDLILKYCLEDGMFKTRAYTWYYVLRACGGSSWNYRYN